MAKLILNGATSGSVTLESPAVSGTTTLTLPATTGNVVTDTATQTLTNKTITSPTITGATITVASTAAPAFSAYQSSAQTLSTVTDTKILFQTEEFDTNNNFASSTFTPTVAGYYQVSASIRMGTSSTLIRMMIWKNGGSYKIGTDVPTANNGLVSTLVYCNGTTDYIEAYGLIVTSQALATGYNTTWFNGVMVRSA